MVQVLIVDENESSNDDEWRMTKHLSYQNQLPSELESAETEAEGNPIDKLVSSKSGILHNKSVEGVMGAVQSPLLPYMARQTTQFAKASQKPLAEQSLDATGQV